MASERGCLLLAAARVARVRGRADGLAGLFLRLGEVGVRGR